MAQDDRAVGRVIRDIRVKTERVSAVWYESVRSAGTLCISGKRRGDR